MSEPAGTGAARAALLELAADPARRPVLLALDFDGTLAPLQDDPTASRVLPVGVRALADLAATPAAGVQLALVSGRAMTDLHRLAEVPPETVLIGSHGAERARVTAHGLDRRVVQLSDAQADLLAELAARATTVARGRDGVWVETKPTAVVVHTRLADTAVGAQAEAQALELASALGVGVLRGKNVVEMSVLPASKGEALRALRAELGARVVIFAGDDTTDEHAFTALGPGDLTVKVGPGATAARFRVPDPDALVGLLADLAAAVRGAPRGLAG
ncbi:trehalose-phosphatase [Cellulomonas hominis]